MYKNTFELQVCVNGKPVKEYRHNSHVFVQANQGTEYTLKVKNNSHRRAMIIASVDGLDVLTGKPAEKAGTGYIVDAYDFIDIKGYRLTDDNVAAFLFSKGEDSYATSKGKGSNNGVIGIRAIWEKEQPAITISHSSYCAGIGNSIPSNFHCVISGSSAPFGARSIATYSCSTPDLGSVMCSTSPLKEVRELKEASFDLGTAFGAKVEDGIKKVEFQQAEMAAEMQLFYASRQALETMGVELNPKKKVSSTSLPQAFNDKWCAPPKGWRG